MQSFFGSLTPVLEMYTNIEDFSIISEHIRKPLVFLCFQGDKKPVNPQILPNTGKQRAGKTLYLDILHAIYEIKRILLLTVRFSGNSA